MIKVNDILKIEINAKKKSMMNEMPDFKDGIQHTVLHAPSGTAF